MERWAGRLALVTGASSGIGAAIAVALANHGIKVVGCARNIHKIQDLQSRVTNKQGSIIAVECDVRNEADILAVFDVCKQHGGVDVCINSAGLAKTAPLLSGETEKWKEMLDVNVLALSIFTREAYQSMKERNVNEGHIIHVSSWAGFAMFDHPVGHFYCATKHCVRALLSGLRNEIKATGSRIRVSEISPGAVETSFTTRVVGADAAQSFHSLYKAIDADDVANAVVFMLQNPPHAELYELILLPTEESAAALAKMEK